MKVVIDTNVWVAGLRSPHGASFFLLKNLEQFTPLLSVPLFFEYEDVLKRPETLQATGLTIGDVDAVFDMIAAKGEEVKINFLWRPKLTDPKDDMVLEVAINGGAEAIVSFNQKDFRNCDFPVWYPKQLVEKIR